MPTYTEVALPMMDRWIGRSNKVGSNRGQASSTGCLLSGDRTTQYLWTESIEAVPSYFSYTAML